jgi:hypothetical protein
MGVDGWFTAGSALACMPPPLCNRRVSRAPSQYLICHTRSSCESATTVGKPRGQEGWKGVVAGNPWFRRHFRCGGWSKVIVGARGGRSRHHRTWEHEGRRLRIAHRCAKVHHDSMSQWAMWSGICTTPPLVRPPTSSSICSPHHIAP